MGQFGQAGSDGGRRLPNPAQSWLRCRTQSFGAGYKVGLLGNLHGGHLERLSVPFTPADQQGIHFLFGPSQPLTTLERPRVQLCHQKLNVLASTRMLMMAQYVTTQAFVFGVTHLLYGFPVRLLNFRPTNKLRGPNLV